ncbi:MAG: hypothetical protein ACYSW3_00080 [Planctomycetota bacterium]|jgi:hypothetical protein
MARIAPEKRQVFKDIQRGQAKYKTIPIWVDISEYSGTARFGAKVGDTSFYNEDLKKLMISIDRRLQGSKVRLDIPVLGKEGDKWTLTTVSANGDVNMLYGGVGRQGREKISPHYVPRYIFRDTDANVARFKELREIRKAEFKLSRRKREVKSSLDNYTHEEILALVEEKTNAKS